MSAKSGKQYRLMQAISHGSKTTGPGPSKEVADEIIRKTSKEKRSLFMRKGKKHGKR